jgi:rRNA maturation endonuclease Nob1
MVKRCNNCGATVVDDKALFCDSCGSKFPQNPVNRTPVCNGCGNPVIDARSKFCNICGTPINSVNGRENLNVKSQPTKQTVMDAVPVKKYSHIPLVADDTKKYDSIHDDKITFNKTEPLRTHGSTAAKRIQETRCTCTACGNVWYFGKKEVFQNIGNNLSNATKDLYACACCYPLFFLKGKDTTDLNKCPNCGSRAIRKEQITHEV